MRVYGAKVYFCFKPILASHGSLVASFLAALLSTILQNVESQSNICAKPLYSWLGFLYLLSLPSKVTMVTLFLYGSMAFSMEVTIMLLRCIFMKKLELEILPELGDSLNSVCLFLMPSVFQL